MSDRPLPPRQFRVAQLIAAGLSDRAIAATMDVTWQCVRRHIERIAVTWNLDRTKSLRVQIAVRFDRMYARAS